MPIFEPGREMKRGDILYAERINAIESELRRLGQIRGGAGLDVRQSRSGLQITGVAQATKYAAIAASAFAPRSGSTVSSGTVTVQWNNAGTLADAGLQTITAWCISSTTMTSGNSIDSGQYCTVWQDPFGTWWASPEECS